MGSANATTAAFTSNVEILLELEGSRAHTGVAKWLEPPPTANNPGSAPSSTSTPGTPPPPKRPSTKANPNSTGYAGTSPPCRSRRTSPSTRTPSRCATPRDPYPPLPGVSLRARPLTLTGWHHVDAHAALDLTVPATLEGLTAFLVYEAKLSGQVTEFVVPAQLWANPPTAATASSPSSSATPTG